jgi:hypothetical protein
MAASTEFPEGRNMINWTRIACLAAALPVVVALATPAMAQERHGPGHSGNWQGGGWQGGSAWRVIGHKMVNGAADTDNIYTPGKQRFRQLRLCAYSAPLRLRDFDVYFRNGGHQDVNAREHMAAGSCTRAIDLKGQARDIERIRLRYERIHRGMRAPIVRVTAR